MQQKVVMLQAAAVPVAAEQRRASLSALLAAPHRLAFLCGTLMLLFVSTWWTALLLAPSLGASVTTSMPPMMVHGFTFAAGFMPLFMTGFLFTAGPRWLDVPPPSAHVIKWPVLLHVAGVALLVVGSLVDSGITAFGALLLATAVHAIAPDTSPRRELRNPQVAMRNGK